MQEDTTKSTEVKQDNEQRGCQNPQCSQEQKECCNQNTACDQNCEAQSEPAQTEQAPQEPSVEELLAALHKNGVQFLSTGGTQAFIESLGYPCKKVEDLTTYPSILGGRVKTLHPKVFGGILGRRELASDQEEMAKYEIPEIDLVIVDLYPFEQTVASGASAADIIEKIDIGGISLIRAAAKNFNDVVIVPSKAEYKPLLDIVTANGAQTELDERRWFATRAFGVSSHYDTAIHAWFEK